MRVRSRALILAAAVGLAAGLASACSSGSPAAGSSSSAAATQSITIAGNAPTFTAAAYVAQDLGYFAAHHVRVTILDNQGPNVPTLVVSGRADIGIGAAAAEPVLLTSKGQHVSVIYGEEGGGISASLVVRPGTTLASLKGMTNCTIGTYPQGTSAYGWATIFSKDLGLKCRFSVYQSAPLQIAALTGGSVNAIIGSPANFSATVAAGKAAFLINCSLAADRAKYVPSNPAWESVDFGIPSNLAAKRTAVEDFFLAYQEAKDWISKNGPAATAKIVVKFPAARAFTLAQLTSTLTTNAPFTAIPDSTGQITQAQWTTSLGFFANFGLPDYSAGNPQYAYAKVIDMSYLQGS
ncbi:MAG TPA: ABC transporter substrate-binding protein [Trebonia sp.]|nr:ABC transporter substrate-binding protein [Trebonia sp.]